VGGGGGAAEKFLAGELGPGAEARARLECAKEFFTSQLE